MGVPAHHIVSIPAGFDTKQVRILPYRYGHRDHYHDSSPHPMLLRFAGHIMRALSLSVPLRQAVCEMGVVDGGQPSHLIDTHPRITCAYADASVRVPCALLGPMHRLDRSL